MLEKIEYKPIARMIDELEELEEIKEAKMDSFFKLSGGFLLMNNIHKSFLQNKIKVHDKMISLKKVNQVITTLMGSDFNVKQAVKTYHLRMNVLTKICKFINTITIFTLDSIYNYLFLEVFYVI